MNITTYFTTKDIALIAVFSGLYATLNLTLGPISVTLLGIPVIHDFAAYFPLLLVTWATAKFGTATLTATTGSIITLILGAPAVMISFAATAPLFDALMLISHHRLNPTKRNVATTMIATSISAYTTGAIIGTIFLYRTPLWTLTFWSGTHLVGALVTVAITLPIITVLHKANRT
jgi:hypothetical protein